MILHAYVARRFAASFLLVAGALSAVYVMLDMVEHIRKFADLMGAGTDMAGILRLTLLKMPGTMYQLLPLMVILATLFLFLNFSRTSEMVVTRAAGRPALVTLMAPVAVVLVIGVAALVVLNPIAAATSREYARAVAHLEGRDSSVVSLGREGFWLRQGDARGQTVIRAEATSPDGTELVNATFFSFSVNGRPTSRINAREARLEPGRWALKDAKIWDLRDLDNPERQAVTRKAWWIASSLTAERIASSFDSPSAIAIWDMPAYIRQLRQAGFSPRRHQVWFQGQLAMPLFLVAMVLLGAALTMRHTRLGRSGLMALVALLLGFGAYFIRNFATILGENGQIPVAVAAWTPPVAALLMALGLILHMEDG